MGYNGFGMQKDVYTRKPKNPFVKLKKIISKESTHYQVDNHKKDENKNDFDKEKMIEKIKNDKRKDLKKNIISIVIAILFLIFISFYVINILKDVL